MSEIYQITDPNLLSKISQLELEEILERLANSPEDEQSNEDQHALVLYAITDLYKRGVKDFTEEDVVEHYTDLLTGYILRRLSEDDYIDISIDNTGEPLYQVTEKGKNEVEKILHGNSI